MIDGDRNSGVGRIFLGATNLYLSLNGRIQKVSKEGGPVTALVNSGGEGFVTDDLNVYYVASGAIKYLPVVVGNPNTLTTEGAVSVADIAIDSEYIYWADNSGPAGFRRIYKASKAPAFDSISIAGPTQVEENFAARYTAMANWTDGTSRPVAPEWSVGSGPGRANSFL